MCFWNQLPLNVSFNLSGSGTDDPSISMDTNTGDDIVETKTIYQQRDLRKLEYEQSGWKIQRGPWMGQGLDRPFLHSWFAINGYDVCRRDRKNGGWGIILYIWKLIPSYWIQRKCSEVECILVDIQEGKQHILLLCAPSVNNANFTREMHIFPDAAMSKWANVVCLGELNCDILHLLDNGKEGHACMVRRVMFMIWTIYRTDCCRNKCFSICITSGHAPVRSEWSQIGLRIS